MRVVDTATSSMSLVGEHVAGKKNFRLHHQSLTGIEDTLSPIRPCPENVDLIAPLFSILLSVFFLFFSPVVDFNS